MQILRRMKFSKTKSCYLFDFHNSSFNTQIRRRNAVLSGEQRKLLEKRGNLDKSRGDNGRFHSGLIH